MKESAYPEAGVLDFAGLTALLSHRSDEVRDHHTAVRNALLRGHGSILSDRERSLLSNMIHALVADMGAAFGRALSVRLAEGNGAADALARSLDERWTDTLQSKLAKAGAVGDLALIAAMGRRVSEHLLELTLRPRPEDRLGAPLADPAPDPFAAEALKSDLRLAKAVSDYLVEKSRRFDGYGNPRLPLYELPSALADRLFWACAAAWREEMLASWQGDEAALDDTVESTVGRALDSTRADSRRLDRLVAAADALADSGELRAALLPTILLAGEVGLFEAALARLANLPLALVRAMTFEPGGARLALAARAAGLSVADFATVDRALAQVRPPARRAEPSAEDVFRGCPDDVADRIVRQWRRRPEYLEALRRYGTVEGGWPAG